MNSLFLWNVLCAVMAVAVIAGIVALAVFFRRQGRAERGDPTRAARREGEREAAEGAGGAGGVSGPTQGRQS